MKKRKKKEGSEQEGNRKEERQASKQVPNVLINDVAEKQNLYFNGS